MNDSSVSSSKVSAHTPEPLVCYSHRGTIINPGADTIALVGDFAVARDGQSYEFHGSDEQDARRIVACVNACADIPTEDLESSPSITEYISDQACGAIQQRDELAELLRAMVNQFGEYHLPAPVYVTAARAALAKLDTDSTKGSKR